MQQSATTTWLLMFAGLGCSALLTLGVVLLFFMNGSNGDDDVYAGLPTVPPAVTHPGLRAKIEQLFAMKSNCRQVLELLRVKLPALYVQIDQIFAQKKGVSKESLNTWWAAEEKKLDSCPTDTWLDDGKSRFSLQDFRRLAMVAMLLDSTISGPDSKYMFP